MYVILEGIIVLFKIFYYYIEAAIHVVLPPSRKDIRGEIVLVTGAGHGIGRELCLEFSRLGARVVLWDINKENNDAVAEKIRKNGGEAFSYTCDVTVVEEIHRVAEQVRKDVGEVTMLVNNAGILYGGSVLSMEHRHIKRTFEVNILAYFWTVKEFLPYMVEQNRGHIVNMASMSAKSGTAYLVDYSSSKYAVYGFTEALTEEIRIMGKDGIRTSCICPMFVDSGLVKHCHDRFNTKILTPKETALNAIDGVLRNEVVLTVPYGMWFGLIIQSLLPRKARDLLKKFLNFGITPQYHPDTKVGEKMN